MKKLISLFLSLFMITGLVACGSSKDVEEPKDPVETVIENEIVRVEFKDPNNDNGMIYYSYDIENLTDQEIIVPPRIIAPGEVSSLGQDCEGQDVFRKSIDVLDSNEKALCRIEYEVTINENSEFSSIKVISNEVYNVDKGLSEDSITIEQIGDSVVDIYAKDECGDFYRTLVTLRITNNTDTKLMVFVGYKEIVIEPGESVEKEVEAMDEIPGDYMFACTAAKDLPFDLEVSFTEYADGTDPYMSEQTNTTFKVTH